MLTEEQNIIVPEEEQQEETPLTEPELPNRKLTPQETEEQFEKLARKVKGSTSRRIGLTYPNLNKNLPLEYKNSTMDFDEPYTQYLITKGHLFRTCYVYNQFLRMWKQAGLDTEESPAQQKVNTYITLHHYSLASCWVKDYLKNYLKNKEEIIIPKKLEKNKLHKQKRFITLEEVNLMLNNYMKGGAGFYNFLHKLIFRLFFETGCRCNELSNIKLDDIDFFDNKILVVIAKGGMSKARQVQISDDTRLCIINYILKALGRDKEYFINERLFPYTNRHIYNIIRDVSEGKIHPHLLRGSIATHLFNRTHNIQLVKEYLGHARIATTEKYLQIIDRERYNQEVKGVLENDSRTNPKI